MAALQQKLKHAIAQAQHEAVIGELLSNGNLTIGELIKIKGELGETIRRVTIQELRAGETGPNGRSASAASRNTQAGSVDTRTRASRRAYQEALYASLKEATEPVSAPELRRKLGGTPDQARRALNRLIETGKVSYTGKARGTRYRAKR